MAAENYATSAMKEDEHMSAAREWAHAKARVLELRNTHTELSRNLDEAEKNEASHWERLYELSGRAPPQPISSSAIRKY